MVRPLDRWSRELRRANLFLDAARSARPSQVLGRARRLIPVAVLGARLGHVDPTGWRPLARGVGVEAAPQSGPTPPPAVDGCFRAVGYRRVWGSPGFWDDPRDGLLFLFCLHGFAELAAAAGSEHLDAERAFWADVLDDWLAAHDRPTHPAWHPYPCSGRLLAWCSALSAGGWDPELERRLRVSVLRQGRFLARNLEWDIGGNHLVRNATALAVAGGCTGVPWMERLGLAVLRHAISDQILPDGGHDERSPSYHRIVKGDLDDVALVLDRGGQPEPTWLADARRRMTAWLVAMAGPDHRLPLLNDAWEGPPLKSPSSLPSLGVTDLDASGYVIVRDGADQAIFDIGPLGPAHLPAHAHADALSFVTWFDGRPHGVDPGTAAYVGPRRDVDRGTAAHNTVSVDGQDQCVFWGPFRASALPRVLRLLLHDADDHVLLVAEHDGYGRLPDPTVHRRAFCWIRGIGLVVVDTLLARASHEVVTSVLLDRPPRDGQTPVRWLGPPAAEEDGLVVRATHLGRDTPARRLRRRLSVAPGDVFGWALAREPVEVETIPGGVRVVVGGRHRVDVPLFSLGGPPGTR